MTIRKTKAAAEAGHWYSREAGGTAMQVLDLVGKNGKRRKPTLRDARAHGWVPGVTTIMRAGGSPEQLVRWRIEQAVLAALTLPRAEGESEADWLERLQEDMTSTAKAAADAGSEIHHALEAHYSGDVSPSRHWGRIQAVANEIREAGAQPDIDPWQAERAVVHPLGFGTKADLHNCELVVDWKTKDGEEMPTRLFDTHLMQLAATRKALEYSCGYPEGSQRCGIIYVSRTHNTARWVEATPEQLMQGWEMFRHLHAFWTARTGHCPSWTLAAMEEMNND
tara:strand:- start:7585 stop:8424 length:840 start_codon:yes stop_codon:yes gene_type:complete